MKNAVFPFKALYCSDFGMSGDVRDHELEGIEPCLLVKVATGLECVRVTGNGWVTAGELYQVFCGCV